MQATFLGTGTSHGIPVIGCGCPVCRSPDPRNRRLRSSLWLRSEAGSVLIDTSPDLREQALRYGVERLDAVVFTHGHADHLSGFDDLRRFCREREKPLPVWADPATCRRLQESFGYALEPADPGTTRPRVSLHEVMTEFEAGGMTFTPLPVKHGRDGALGYRVESQEGGSLVYIPDCCGVTQAVLDRMTGCGVCILDALRYRPHPTHFSLDQSLAVLHRVQPRRGFVTHLCHDMEHSALQAQLPDGVEVPYDGMILDV